MASNTTSISGRRGAPRTLVTPACTPRRTAAAIVRLLEIEEGAATRGHWGLRRLAALKAAQAARALHNEALERCGEFNRAIKRAQP